MGSYKGRVVYGHTNTGIFSTFASEKRLQNKDENPRLQTKETTNPDHEFLSVPAILELTSEIVLG